MQALAPAIRQTNKPRTTNLDPLLDDTSTDRDIYVYDRNTDTVELVSKGPDGMGGFVKAANATYVGTISADGQLVAFYTEGDNLLTADSNNEQDVYVFDRGSDTVELISKHHISANSGNGNSANPAISADGRYVAFHSWSNDLHPADQDSTAGGLTQDEWGTDIFVYDRDMDVMEMITQRPVAATENVASSLASISADGGFVAFQSRADNLIPADIDNAQDVYVYDRDTDSLELVSKSSTGVKGNGRSWRPSISADGRFVAFQSAADNLDPDDADTGLDIYVYDRQSDTISLVSRNSDGTKANGESQEPTLSPDASLVMFRSNATNLDGAEGQFQVFVKELGLDPVTELELVVIELQSIVDANPDTETADKLVDVIAALGDALSELGKTPPDTQAAMGAIEGAVGDLEAAVSSGLINAAQGTQLMTQIASAARQLAADAIDAATAGGGDPFKIADAELALADGDTLQAAGAFKDAVAMYKDAVSQAEAA